MGVHIGDDLIDDAAFERQDGQQNDNNESDRQRPLPHIPTSIRRYAAFGRPSSSRGQIVFPCEHQRFPSWSRFRLQRITLQTENACASTGSNPPGGLPEGEAFKETPGLLVAVPGLLHELVI